MEWCPNCEGVGCKDCYGLGFIFPVSQAQKDRVSALFYQKLAERYPGHPWTKKDESMSKPTIGTQIGIQLEAMHEHINMCWSALRKEGRDISGRYDGTFPGHSIEDWLQTIEVDHGKLFQLLAKVSPEVGNT